jgi:hypothetical protein
MTNLPQEAEILLYSTEDGTIKIDVLAQDDTLWLTQKKMAALFGVQRPAITKHLKNIFETKELEENSVCSILEHTAPDGKIFLVPTRRRGNPVWTRQRPVFYTSHDAGASPRHSHAGAWVREKTLCRDF